MKNNNKLSSALRRKVIGIGTSMYSLSGDLKSSIRPFISEIWRIARLCFKGDIGRRIRSFNNFYVSLRKIEKNHGAAYTIKYLKACQVSIQRVIAKSPYRTLRELEPDLPFPRLYSGLPSLIPLSDRRLIRQGHLGVIRFWLTLFGIYRVLKGPLKSKLNTITDPYTGQQEILMEFKEFIDIHLWRLLSSLNFTKRHVNVESNTFVHNSSSGPNNSMALGSILTDLWWYIYDSTAYANFQKYCDLTDSHLGYLMQRNIKLCHKIADVGGGFPIKGRFAVDSSIREGESKEIQGTMYHFWSPYSTNPTNFVGGQLSFKEEAAGKLRVFAMVDIWTQSLLSPFHHSIYQLLKSFIPNDGTSNQEASFQRVLDKSMESGSAWSVDLSSATDRLPISIQCNIVSTFTGISGLGEAWRALLVDRDYLISGSPEKLESYGLKPQRIRYAVGQPMGALSSFAMLGLTHHLIVQFAVHLVRGAQAKWYTKYEIVGDDIVLFENDIYLKYIELLAKLGVPANPSKSIPSPTVPSAEFLKRTALGGKDVSPISWKELLQGHNLPSKVNFLLRMLNRSLIHNTLQIKAVLCRYGTEVTQPLKVGATHSLVSVISSIFSRKFGTLHPSLCILLDPQKDSKGAIDYSNISIPENQVMKLLLSINDIHSLEDISKYISKYEIREHIVARGLSTMISKAAIKTALELILEVKANRTKLLKDFSAMLVDLESTVFDNKDHRFGDVSNIFKNIDARPLLISNKVEELARRVLIPEGDNLEQRITILESKHFKAPLRGIPLDQAINLLDDTVLYASKFSLEKTRHGQIPVDNKVSILAIKAQRSLTPAWQSFLDFHNNFIEMISKSPKVSTTYQVPNTSAKNAGLPFIL